jgi:ankyrin repeat protein
VNSRGARCGETALSLASSRGHLETMKLLLNNGADIDDAYISGQTPMWEPAESRRKEAVKLLLERGARVEKLYESSDAYAAEIDPNYFWPNEKRFLEVISYVNYVRNSQLG